MYADHTAAAAAATRHLAAAHPAHTNTPFPYKADNKSAKPLSAPAVVPTNVKFNKEHRAVFCDGFADEALLHYELGVLDKDAAALGLNETNNRN